MKYDIKQTDIFSKWLLKLKDIQGKVSILRRVDRIRKGNFGDHKGLGDEVSELRISVGAGYRVYYTIESKKVVLLLVGGDKSSQKVDIQKAKALAKELKDDK
jgi:putative addiction module killer protein